MQKIIFTSPYSFLIWYYPKEKNYTENLSAEVGK